ncbi:MAG: SUMF1/EgtB/PvdO family nonheme iron enzyme [Saprospiraceae bacterium]|nr:SUMF1/EgtB/PvdO family nonheme iron enzyme [Saprospiraceae bacterium]
MFSLKSKIHILLILSVSCGLFINTVEAQKKKNKKSEKTTWTYDSSEWGGFEKLTYNDLTYNDLIFIEGGTYNMGQSSALTSKDELRRVTVSSFFIDATEVHNKHYREFVAWMRKYEPEMPKVHLLPDTTLWTLYVDGEVGEQLAKDYYRLAAFDYYPVVGVNWIQAHMYLQWRTDRKNEEIAIAEGFIDAKTWKDKPFYTNDFLDLPENKDLYSYFLPDYRLPMESEWEFAAWALIGSQYYPRGENPKTPFYQYSSTNRNKKHASKAVRQFRNLVKKHNKSNPVPAYYDHTQYRLPKSIFDGDINAYGLFNTSDNVSEWTQDVYRSFTSSQLIDAETHDLNPFRGNVFNKKDSIRMALDKEGLLCQETAFAENSKIQQGSKAQFYSVQPKFYDEKGEELLYKDFYTQLRNPRSPYQIVETDEKGNLHFKQLSQDEFEQFENKKAKAEQKIIEDNLQRYRVIKGANVLHETGKIWPGVRWAWPEEALPPNYLEDHQVQPIGFRAAMTRVGSPDGGRFIRGNQMKTKRKYR